MTLPDCISLHVRKNSLFTNSIYQKRVCAMKLHLYKKYICWGITAFLVICASICFYYLLFHSSNLWSGIQTILNITMPILDGFVLAYLLSPVLNHIESKLLYPAFCAATHTKKTELKNKTAKKIRKLSILITLFLVAFCVYCFFSILIPQLADSIQSIILQFPYYIQNLNEWILGIFEDNPDLEQTANIFLERYSSRVEEWVTYNLVPQANALLRTVSSGLIGSVIGVARALWNFLIGVIISVYLLDGKENFAGQGKKIMYSLLHKDTANVFISNVRFIHKTFIGFISGKIVDSIIIGIICYFGTNLMGTPYPMLISVIIGVTNIIPFFGPYMGAIPSAILILMVSPPQCLYFIIFIFILQQFDGNILGPKILGDSTGLNSFWVIFSITFFGGLFGVIGMVIGVPVFAVFYAGVKAITNRRLEEKGLPVSTNDYLKVLSIEENGSFTQYERRPTEQKSSGKKAMTENRPGFGDSWLLLKRRNNRNPEKKEQDTGCATQAETENTK